MPIEPVKIPQNVYVEDRIVGPVTLRQLIILLVSGGFSYALWTGVKAQTGYASIPLTILCWIPFVIGLAFSFVRIQSISLLRFLLLMIEKLDKPQIRAWAPRRGITINFQYALSKPAEEKPKSAPQPHRQKLEELSALLDQGPITAQIARSPETDAIAGSPERRPVDPRRISVNAPGDTQTFDDIREPPEKFNALASEPLRTGTLLDLLPPKPNNS